MKLRKSIYRKQKFSNGIIQEEWKIIRKPNFGNVLTIKIMLFDKCVPSSTRYFDGFRVAEMCSRSRKINVRWENASDGSSFDSHRGAQNSNRTRNKIYRVSQKSRYTSYCTHCTRLKIIDHCSLVINHYLSSRRLSWHPIASR
jgi:hypothetical protein